MPSYLRVPLTVLCFTAVLSLGVFLVTPHAPRPSSYQASSSAAANALAEKLAATNGTRAGATTPSPASAAAPSSSSHLAVNNVPQSPPPTTENLVSSPTSESVTYVAERPVVAPPPADTSYFQKKIDDLNGYINNQIAALTKNLNNLTTKVDSKTAFTVFAQSQKIDQLIAPKILNGITISSGDITTSSGNLNIAGTATFNSTVNVTGALSAGSFSASTISLSQLTSTANAVGIASSTPWGLLSVNPDGITGPAFVIGSSTATNFVVTNGGNVGIGTTNPVSAPGLGGQIKVEVIGGAQTPLALQTTGTSGYGLALQNTNAASNWTRPFAIFQEDTGVAEFSNYGLDSVMTIGTTGHIGIGTTSPGALLSVNGPILAQTGTSTFGGLISPTLFSTTTLGFYTGSNATPQMTIDTSGNVAIGTTTTGITFFGQPSGTKILNILGSGQNAFLSLGNDAAVNDGDLLAQIQAGAASYNTAAKRTSAVIRFYADGTTAGNRGGAITFDTHPNGDTGNGALERMRITNSGNVGIGTTSPAFSLDVNGTIHTSGRIFLGHQVTTGMFANDISIVNGGFYRALNAAGSNNIKLIGLDSSDKVTIDASGQGSYFSGNVGIGTTSPGAALTIGGSGQISIPAAAQSVSNIAITAGTATNYVGQLLNNGAGNLYFSIDNSVGTLGAGAYTGMVWMAGNHNLAFGTNNLPRMTIDNTGNVGIGTTSPQLALSVVGSIRAGQGNGDPGFLLYKGDSGSTNLYANIINTGPTSVTNRLAIGFANTELGGGFSEKVSVLNSSGNVGIGTTSPNVIAFTGPVLTISHGPSSAGTAALEIAGNRTNDGSLVGSLAFINAANTSAEQRISSIVGDRDGANNSGLLSFYTLNAGAYAERMRITATGNVGIGTTSPWGLLSVNPNGITGPAFVIGSSTATNFIVTNAGNVGIGTTSPPQKFTLEGDQAKLLVNSNTDGTAGAVLISTGQTTSRISVLALQDRLVSKWSMRKLIDNSFDIYDDAAGLTRLAIDTSGNVGIGTTTPDTTLSVNGTTKLGNGQWPTVNLANTGQRVGIFSDVDIGYLFVGDMRSGVGTDRGGDLRLGARGTNGTADLAYGRIFGARENATSGNLAAYLSLGTTNSSGVFGEAMRITSAGNVGIGTTSPSQLLTVAGVGNFSVTSGTALLLNPSTMTNQIQYALQNTGGSAYFGIESSAGGAAFSGTAAYSTFIGNNTARSLHLITNSSIRATIDSSGNVGIGTTSPQLALSVVGSIRAGQGNGDPGFLLYKGDSGSTNLYANIINTGPTSVTNRLAIGFANTELGGGFSEKVSVLNSSGNVGIGTTTPAEKLAVAGNIIATGCLHYNVNTTAGTCVDIAESYPAGEDLAPAFIVSAHPDPSSPEGFSVVKATSAAGILGVISTRPAVYMEGDTAFFGGSRFTATSTFAAGSSAPLALAGRVPVAVNLDGGPIAVGDRIALSSVPGIGAKATSSGETIGIALAPFDPSAGSGQTDANGIGKIMVFVNLGYAKLDDVVTELGTKSAALGTGSTSPSSSNLAPSSVNAWSVSQTSGKVNVNFFGDVSLNGNAIINVSKIIGMWGKWTIDEEGKLFVKEIETETIKSNKGYTVPDEDTGEPYCIKVKGGVLITVKGACGATSGGPPTLLDSSASNGAGNQQPATDSPALPTTPDTISSSTPETTATNNGQPTTNNQQPATVSPDAPIAPDATSSSTPETTATSTAE